jgi:hypothetical protein
MVVTIVAPQTGAPFGQGFTVSASSDFVGAITNPLWIIEIRDNDNVELWNNWVLAAGSPFSVPFITGYKEPLPSQVFDGITIDRLPTWATIGDSVRLNVILSGNAGVVDSGHVDVVLSADMNTRVLSKVLKSSDVVTADVSTIKSTMNVMSADVTAIKGSTFKTFGPGVVTPIAELISAPPLGFLHRELITPDRSGEGNLTHTLSPAFGLTWEVISAGEGIGVEEGAPDSLVTKMLQLQLIHTLGDSSQETTFTGVFDYGDALLIFTPPLPSIVRYWIGPSIVVRFHWLVL